MLNKQAKILTDSQIQTVLSALEDTRHALRNKLMFLLTLHGLRAVEVASLEISMVTDAEGNVADEIALEDKASKGRSGRVVFMNAALKETLVQYLQERGSNLSPYVIVTERSERFSAHAVVVFFERLYKSLGFKGAYSHSGRRSYATRAARKIILAGGSLKDVQTLLGHRHLTTTQRYISDDVDAQRRVTSMLY